MASSDALLPWAASCNVGSELPMLDHLQVEAVNAPVRVTWRVRTLIYERGVEQCVILCVFTH